MGIVMHFADAGLPGANRITLLRDIGPDGVAKTKTVFLDHLTSPFGVALIGHDLYVADTDALLRFPYKDGDTHIDASGTKVTDLPAGRSTTTGRRASPPAPMGRSSMSASARTRTSPRTASAQELDRAAIWEIDPATGLHRIFASGVRNPTGLQFEPQSHKLWTVANERDELGPDLVPDYLTSVKDGGFYGWPYSYYGQHVDPRVMPQRPDLVATAIPPDYALSSHVAPLGLVFGTSPSLPAEYQGGAFVSEHGSWDRGAAQRLQGRLRAVFRRHTERAGAGFRDRLFDRRRPRDGAGPWGSRSTRPARC